LTSQPAIGFTPALREARLNVHDSSECAGFSDSRNFGQAFKKWTDTAPGSRRTHH
jgi:AraC-like DNA-binding protein